MRIILASKSPARKELLSSLGLKPVPSAAEGFSVVPAEIDEGKVKDPKPSQRVKKLAFLKGKKALRKLTMSSKFGVTAWKIDAKKNKGLVIIAADTMVYFRRKKRARRVYLPKKRKQSTINSQQMTKNGVTAGIFVGKPKNLRQAREILRLLSGTTHFLYTGVCVIYGKEIFLDYEKTRVTFRKLKETEIEEYVRHVNPLLYAGGYTIDKGTMGASFVKKIKGSRTNVMGLPLEKLRMILREIRLLK